MPERASNHSLFHRFVLPVLSIFILFHSSCDQKPLSLSPEADTGEWRPLLKADAGLLTNVNSLWGFGDGTVLAGHYSGIVARYDGSDWDEKFAVFDGYVDDIWGESPDDLYVLTRDTLNHFDGSGWSEVGPGGSCMWGFASGDLFVAGQDVIRHFDGVSWTEIFSQPDTYFMDAWGSSPDNVYFTSLGGIFHFDGDTTVSLPNAGRYHTRGVWGSSASDIFFVGTGGQILHFDGAGMTDMNAAVPIHYICVWGSGPGDVYAAGYNGMAHYDGITWAKVDVGYDTSFYSLWGNGPNDVYAGYRKGRVLHFDGNGWTSIRGGTPAEVVIAWASPSSDDLVVGDRDQAYFVYDGDGWEELPPNPLRWGAAIWGEAVDDFNVAHDRYITHFDGASWAVTDTLDNSALAVWKYSRDLVYLAGSAIQKFDGSSWIVEYDGTANLVSIHGSSPSNIFAAGRDRDGGLVLRYDGSEWRVLISGVGDLFRAVWVASETEVYFGGYFQGIVKYDGERWVVEPTLDGERGYRAFWGASRNELYAAGDRAIEFYNGVLWTPSFRQNASFDHLTGRAGGRVYATTSSGDLWYTEAR